MKKVRLLLLILPLVAGALYLRSLASWRPKPVLVGMGDVEQLTFSSDGRTLIALQGSTAKSSPRLLALDVTRGFARKWVYEEPEGLMDMQLFAADTRILVNSSQFRTFDARRGKRLWDHGDLGRAVMSPDGKWLAYDDYARVNRPLPRPDNRVVLKPISSSQYKAETSSREIIGGENSTVIDFAFSPDGKTFVVAIGELDGMYLNFYDAKTWKRQRVWRYFQASRSTKKAALGGQVQWSRDGRFLLSSWSIIHSYAPSGHIGVTLWRMSDGKKLVSTKPYVRNGHLIYELQNDGRFLSFGTDSHVYVDTAGTFALSSKTLLSLPGETVKAASMSPDGLYLVAGTQSGRIYSQRLK